MENTNMEKDKDYVLQESAMAFLATHRLILSERLVHSLLPLPENQASEASITFYRFCVSNFPNSLSVKLLRVYASRDPRFEDNVRESAIRRLDALLSDRREACECVLDDVSIQELAPLLIHCLEERGTREDTFKILVQVAHHVAFEIFNNCGKTWPCLRRFMTSRAHTEFRKAAYVFVAFSSIPSDDGREGFVMPLLETMIPPILRWLQPSESNNNNWYVAFLAAFCAGLHLVETVQVEMMDYIVGEMVNSVTELVNRGMEVGFVRRGFREVEMLVRKQVHWYGESEYDFVTGLIKKMKEIKGMKKETKTVLWRIHMALKIRVTKGEDEKEKLQAADTSLASKAKLGFTNPRLEQSETLVSKLFQELEIQEKCSATAIYIFCWDYLHLGLAEMIFKVYLCSKDASEIRSESISLLCGVLTHFRQGEICLTRNLFTKIKPLLISTLVNPTRDSDIEILAKIVSLVAADVFEASNNGWDELCICIVCVAEEDLRKALCLFRDLPSVYESFLFHTVKRLLPEILTLLSQELGEPRDWSLGLQSGFKMAIQVSESPRTDLAGNILYAALMSASKLVRQEKQEVLQLGLEELRLIVKESTNQYKYNTDQHKFALDFASMMARMTGAERKTKAAAREIYQILKSQGLSGT